MQDIFSMQVFGHIRFSFFGKNDTKISRLEMSDTERFNTLYAPERMETRFHFFENITLPSLRTQDDQDFRIIVASSEVMPDVYKARLLDICADMPQIKVLFSKFPSIQRTCNKYIRAELADAKERSVHFRLDDDDAMSRHVIGKLRRDAEILPSSTHISYPSGFLLAPVDEAYKLIRKNEPHIAIGWGVVFDPGEENTPYSFRHGAYHRNNPSFVDPRGVHYIHTAHAFSDTVDNQARKVKQAISQDNGFGTEGGDARTAELIADAFPGFTVEKFAAIMQATPGSAS
ncbi:MAG: glycosyltransferase [Maritimibacter sp.]